jgi:hypothetical protein
MPVIIAPRQRWEMEGDWHDAAMEALMREQDRRDRLRDYARRGGQERAKSAVSDTELRTAFDQVRSAAPGLRAGELYDRVGLKVRLSARQVRRRLTAAGTGR